MSHADVDRLIEANGNLPGTKASRMPAAHTTQLCTTNLEVVEAMTKAALEKIAANPEAGFISISQNDNTNYCRCPRCQKMAEEEKSKGWKQSSASKSARASDLELHISRIKQMLFESADDPDPTKLELEGK